MAVLLAGAWIWLRPDPTPIAANGGTVQVSQPSGGAPPIVVPPGHAALAIDLEVAQAVGAVAATLFVRLDLDGRTVKTLSLRFPAGEQPLRRESVVVEGLSPGSHRLEVTIDTNPEMPPTGGVYGIKELALAEGMNRLPVKATIMGGDRSIEFLVP